MKKTSIISALAVLTVLAAVLTSFVRMRAAEAKMPHVVLPAAEDAAPAPSGDALESLGQAPFPVEITRENVLRLIASMDRPEEYAAEMLVTLRWDGGETSTQSRVWRSGALERISYTEGGVSYNCVIDGERTYLWEQGSSDCYECATGAFTSDSAARLPAYEDLVSMDGDVVTDCEAAELDGVSCLFLRTVEGPVARVWYLELESGLLRRMEEYRSGELKYSVEALSLTVGPVEAARFILPDGRDLTRER